MIKAYKKSLYLILTIAIFALSVLLPIYMGIRTNSVAFAADTYSNVMDDLSKDSSFNPNNYPDKENDYSLQVISIAESTTGELFIYVYQPSHNAKDLSATSINISLTVEDDFAPKNYKLQLASTQGVFDKYVVEGLSVRTEEEVRYYNISSILRAWDKDIDGSADNGNTINEKGFSVGKLYTAYSNNGAVNYTCSEIETIEITEKYCGFVRYLNGFKLYVDSCDAWYVAFDTDKPIDKLIEADVYYVSQSYTYEIWGLIPSKKYGDSKENIAKLNYTDVVSNSADGLFAKKYTWNRIESVSGFIANEDLTDETKEALKDKKWVLRFVETRYSYISSANHSIENRTIVSDVMILRLKFETDGVTYNLGVVDNKQSADPTKPDNNNAFDFDFSKKYNGIPWYYWILAILLLIVLLIILWLLSPIFKPIFTAIGKFVCFLITLPFKLIGAIFKGIFGRKRKNE